MIPYNEPMSGSFESDIGPVGGGSGFYREISSTQREQIQAAGKQFVKETNSESCLVVIGRIIGREIRGSRQNGAYCAAVRNVSNFPRRRHHQSR
jgi:hypothetical protein